MLYGWSWDARQVIGMAVAAIGFAFSLTARLQLGKSFAILAKAQALVTTGLDSKFRNPAYLFGGLRLCRICTKTNELPILTAPPQSKELGTDLRSLSC